MRVLQPWGKAAALGMRLLPLRGRFSTRSHALSMGITRRASTQLGASLQGSTPPSGPRCQGCAASMGLGGKGTTMIPLFSSFPFNPALQRRAASNGFCHV